MGTLYHLAAEYNQIDHQLDLLEENAESAEILSSALWDMLKIVEEDTDRKVASIVRWRENEIARAEALDVEIKTLKVKKKAAQNKADSLTRFLGDFMNTVGAKKWDAGIRKLSFRKPSKSLDVDPSQIDNWPAEIYDAAIESGAVRLCYEVRKTQVKDLPGYLALPGVREVEGERSLVVR